jgi:hypothetical protein
MTPTTGVNAKASGTFAIGGDLTVNRLGFGAMRITGDGIWGEPKDREGAKKVLRSAVELGVNFIDTADSYGPEVSEQLNRRSAGSLRQGRRDCDEGGSDAAGAKPMAARGSSGISHSTGGDEPASAEAGTNRPVAVAPHRPRRFRWKSHLGRSRNYRSKERSGTSG